MAKDEGKKLCVLELAKKMNREFKDSNMSLMADVVPEYTRLATGSFGLDYVLYGGMPYGRIIKVSGLQHAGKTTGACRILAEYQKQNPDKICVYVDVEHSLDLKFQMKINGVDLNKLVYVNPPAGMSGEDILQLILDYQSADDIGMIVLDSIPALVPQIVLDSDMTEDKGMRATMAKKLYPFLSIMSSEVQSKNNIFMLINQVREVAGAMPGSITYKEPGGKAPEYFSSVCIRFGTRTFTLGENMDACKKEDGLGADGFRLKFKITKNKTAAVNRAGGFITYRYKTGPDKVNDLLEIAFKFDYIKRLNNVTYQLIDLFTGEIYEDENGEILQGKKAELIEYLKSHPDFLDQYINMVTRYISSDDVETGSALDEEDLAEITAQEALVARNVED
jgi:recombination protein RecA